MYSSAGGHSTHHNEEPGGVVLRTYLLLSLLGAVKTQLDVDQAVHSTFLQRANAFR